MRHHITLFVLFFSAFTLSGQQPALNTIPVKDIDQLILPKQDNQALQEAELQRRGPGIAPQFALPVQVLVTPESHGTWEITRDGKAVWRLYIQSAGAKSLNLGFTKYFMPPGGELLLYSPDVNHLMGPFTPADNEEHEQLWTPILEGDELVIEVRLAPEHMEDLQLELSWVNHDYLGFKDMSSLLSGACNLDVVCGEDDGWSIVDDYRDIIQSVAVISTGGSTFCSDFWSIMPIRTVRLIS